MVDAVGGYLRRVGHTVLTISDPGNLNQLDPAVELVLLDLGLGHTSGLQVLSRLKASQPNVPVLIYTGMGYDNPSIMAEATRRGAAGALSKSAPLSALASEIAQTLRLEQPAHVPEESPPNTSTSPGKKLAVLVVDDDPVVLHTLSVVLRDEGHDVVTAAKPSEALAAAAARRFDLVLTDYSMPEMNGLELAAKLRAIAPNLPIALITAQPGQLSAEVDPVPTLRTLYKPVKLDDLRSLLSLVTPAQ